MNFRKPLIAALVAAALFGAFLLDRQRTVASEEDRIRVGRIMPFDFVHALRLTIDGENGRFVVEKDDAGIWRITEPVSLRADEDRVRTIIDNVHASKKTNPFPARDLSEYGLEPPEARIVVEGTDTETGRPSTANVLIGGDAPRMSRVYAMVEGEDTIFTALDTLRNQTKVSLNDLRDRRLVYVRPNAVEALQVNLPSGSIRMERIADGRWMMDDGVTPANRTMIEEALFQMSEVRAIRLLKGDERPDAETTGLGGASEVRIVAETPEGEIVLTIGRKAAGEDMFYAAGDALADTVAVVRVRDIGTFIQPRREWVSPRFLWARPDEVEQIEIHSAGSMFVVMRGEDGTWRFEDQPESPVHPRRVTELLTNLSNLQGKQLIAERATREQMSELYGVRDESYEIAAIMEDGRTEGFLMGRTDVRDMAQYLVRIQDNSVWVIDAGTLHMYTTLRGDLRDKRIHHGYRDKVASVTFSTDQSSVELVRDTRVWRLHLSQGRRQVVPEHLVEQFLTMSEELSQDAEVFLASRPPVEFVVRYADADGNVVHEMTIHKPDEDARTVMVSVGETLYEAVLESYVAFQKACDELILTGQQMTEQQD